VNFSGRAGVSPLAAAAYHGSSEIVEILLAHHADPNLKDTMGKTPILYAAARGFSTIVARLLATGIDVNTPYGNDLTALMWAAGHADDVPEQDAIELVTMLLSLGAQVDKADNRGRTALMIAAEQGHKEVVETLLNAGADTSHRDRDGRLAVDLAPSDELRQVLMGTEHQRPAR
jgi:ankyrin repeat protein